MRLNNSIAKDPPGQHSRTCSLLSPASVQHTPSWFLLASRLLEYFLRTPYLAITVSDVMLVLSVC